MRSTSPIRTFFYVDQFRMDELSGVIRRKVSVVVPVNVFEYVDYRLFMKAFYESKKKSPGSFSYRRFSRLAENASPNFVKLVVDGQRNLTVLNIHKFALAMALSPIEHDFFVALVHFTQEEDGDCQNYYRARMLSILQDREGETLAASASCETPANG